MPGLPYLISPLPYNPDFKAFKKKDCEQILEKKMPSTQSFIDCPNHLALNYNIWYI